MSENRKTQLDTKSNLLLQGMAAVITALVKSNPHLKDDAKNALSICKEGLISDNYGNIYKALVGLSKNTSSPSSSTEEELACNDEVIQLAGKVGKFKHGVVSK